MDLNATVYARMPALIGTNLVRSHVAIIRQFGPPARGSPPPPSARVLESPLVDNERWRQRPVCRPSFESSTPPAAFVGRVVVVVGGCSRKKALIDRSLADSVSGSDLARRLGPVYLCRSSVPTGRISSRTPASCDYTKKKKHS